MSHSTTTTATYTLVKYSRSYPNSAQDANSEWQHYTKPTLKLILDVKKSLTTGELESVFLRIVWSMENSYAQDQSEVSFENFDLLSFSSFSTRQTDRQQGGLPLKAVYRDSVVGIRYVNASNGTFRRFQITFSSANDASQFIDSISSVCPCKANSTAGPPNIPQMMSAPSLVPPVLHHPIAKPPILNNSAYAQTVPISAAFPLSHMHNNNIPLNQTDVFFPVTPSQRLSTYPTMHFPYPGAPYASVSGMPMPSSQMLVDHPNQIPSSSPLLPPPSSQPPFQFGGSQAHSQSAPFTPTPTQSEHPYYSQSGSVNQQVAFSQTLGNEIIKPVKSKSKVESSEKEVQTTDPFVFALREATSLYDMPRHSLEKLVGDVVREDGFVHLVSTLNRFFTTTV
ncbi:hypothetical protein C8R41DRAFT_819736 [Lentinula lateritia]|uniref:Proteophosphoglycan 5 n=1 Tax=Lentinula lateritia TaxID=40482 RepID=A0ABQ8VRW9_9AGAR|nr:hypothetical protein C8R41DRAFT_819736 [Lentinula lateritia]